MSTSRDASIHERVRRRDLRGRREGGESNGHGYVLILDWLAPCRDHNLPVKPAMPVRSVESARTNAGEDQETRLESLKPNMTK